MGFNPFKKLTVVILALWMGQVLAARITLVYEPEDSLPVEVSFNLEDGTLLTHEFLSEFIMDNFGFSAKDLDRTTVAVINEEDRSLDICVDLEIAGEIREFSELVGRGGDLKLTVIKNRPEDMSDVDSSSSDSPYTVAAARNLITVIYDPPVEQDRCEYVYDADEYGELTYLRLRQIISEKCGVAKKCLDKCYAGLSVGMDVIPLADLANKSMEPIPGLRPGSIIRVFNWEI